MRVLNPTDKKLFDNAKIPESTKELNYVTGWMLGKRRALRFYARALLESCGLIKSVHQVSGEEKKFAEFAISHSHSIVDCGPRLDTELVAIAMCYGVKITLFEASPVFARKLKKKIKAMVRQTDIVTVKNMGVSSHSGSLRYYFLNQSFVKNVPYRTYWFGRKVRVTSLDDFLKPEINQTSLSLT